MVECMTRTYEKKLRKVEKKITLWGSPEKAKEDDKENNY